MNYRTFAATAGMVAALAVASQALAQAAPPRAAAAPAAAPAQPAPPPIAYGPPIAGFCVLDGQRAAATSLAGKAMFARMKVIQDQVNADLNTQDKQLQADAQALQAQQAQLDQTTLESRAAALQVRKNGLQRLAQQRQAELEKTFQNAQVMLSQAMEPSVRAVFQTQHCSLLIDRAAGVIFANPAMDVTDQVVANLNTRVQTLNFDRVNLTAQFSQAH
jgi:Skp family chaperone for outer membrane proteins